MKAFYVVEERDGYRVVLVDSDVSGYDSGSMLYFQTVEEAQKVADEKNESMGVTKLMRDAVVVASMFNSGGYEQMLDALDPKHRLERRSR